MHLRTIANWFCQANGMLEAIPGLLQQQGSTGLSRMKGWPLLGPCGRAWPLPIPCKGLLSYKYWPGRPLPGLWPGQGKGMAPQGDWAGLSKPLQHRQQHPQICAYMHLEPAASDMEHCSHLTETSDAPRGARRGLYSLTDQQVWGKLRQPLIVGQHVPNLHRADHLSWPPVHLNRNQIPTANEQLGYAQGCT